MREEDREEELKFPFLSNNLPSLCPEIHTVFSRRSKRGGEIWTTILCRVSPTDGDIASGTATYTGNLGN